VESVTVSVDDSKVLITALFLDEAHSKLRGNLMALTAVDNGGSIGFACKGSGIESCLPMSCADVTDPAMAVASSANANDGRSLVTSWVAGLFVT